MNQKTSINSSDIKVLEKKTNLTPDELNLFRSKMGGKLEYYVVGLYILINGASAIGDIISVYDATTKQQKVVKVADEHFKMVFSCAYTAKLQSAIQTRTPAGTKGVFKEDAISGKEGVVMTLNNQRIPANPVTGPAKTTPSLTENLLNSIHPNFVSNVEKYCNIIRSRSYLSLPATCFGSIQSYNSRLNGVVTSIQKLIFDVYAGCIKAIQQFYAMINGVIARVQRMIFNVIEQIIPISLICLILEAVQTILDDLAFFSALFGQNGSLTKILNSVQNTVNVVSGFVSNPWTTVSAYIPKSVYDIIDKVNQIGFDPNGYLSDQLANYGYSYMVNALQGDILGAIINKYGPQYAAIGPISQLLNSSEGYSRSMAQFNPTPFIIGPNVYSSNNYAVDTNLNPYTIFKESVSNFIKS